jgi:hypothetical protein
LLIGAVAHGLPVGTEGDDRAGRQTALALQIRDYGSVKIRQGIAGLRCAGNLVKTRRL